MILINSDEYDMRVTFLVTSERLFDMFPKAPDDGWILVDYKPFGNFGCSFLWAKRKSFNDSNE